MPFDHPYYLVLTVVVFLVFGVVVACVDRIASKHPEHGGRAAD